MERGLSTLWVRCTQCERVDILTEPSAFILMRAAGLLRRPCPGSARVGVAECGGLERLVQLLPAVFAFDQDQLVLEANPVTEEAYGHAARHRD
jgi:hypothetical protein